VLWDGERGWVADYTRLRLQARRPGESGHVCRRVGDADA
jgi:hypothetical protein